MQGVPLHCYALQTRPILSYVVFYRFTAAVVVPLAAKFGLLNGRWLILNYYEFFNRFQVGVASYDGCTCIA